MKDFLNDTLRMNRRTFLKLGSTATAAAGVGLGSRRLVAMEQGLGGKDYSPTTGTERQAIPYTCLACNIEDGGIAYVENGRVVKLEGNMDHPNTRGKLCAKGRKKQPTIITPVTNLTHSPARCRSNASAKWLWGSGR